MTIRASRVPWLVAAIAVAALFTAGAARAAAQRGSSDGWQIPPNAEGEASPVAVTPVALASGKAIYRDRCARCHGPSGKGDGADADPDRPPADLTDPSRAARNPDGVLFYKIWNGRKKPRMPAFNGELSREEVWTLIQYVKSLRE